MKLLTPLQKKSVFTESVCHSTIAGAMRQCALVTPTDRSVCHLLPLPWAKKGAGISAEVVIDANTEKTPEMSATILIATSDNDPQKRFLGKKLRARLTNVTSAFVSRMHITMTAHSNYSLGSMTQQKKARLHLRLAATITLIVTPVKSSTTRSQSRVSRHLLKVSSIGRQRRSCYVGRHSCYYALNSTHYEIPYTRPASRRWCPTLRDW